MPKSRLRSGRFLLFFLCASLSCCSEKRTTYTPEEGVEQWVNIDESSAQGVVFFARVEIDTLKAWAEINTKFGELDHYELLDLNIAELEQTTSRINVILTDEQHTQEFRLFNSTWESAIRRFGSLDNIPDTLPVILTYERGYKVSPLPVKLQLEYRIGTPDTLVTGSKSFKAEVTEVPVGIHWH